MLVGPNAIVNRRADRSSHRAPRLALDSQRRPPILNAVDYLRGIRDDVRLAMAGGTDLLVISITASLAFIVGRYLPPLVSVPAFWTSTKNYALANAAYLILPLLSLPLLRRGPAGFGWKHGRVRVWLRDITLLYAAMLPLVLIAARQPAFQRIYPYFAFERDSTGWLLLGLGIRLFGMCCWESIFRGYLLFGFERRSGTAAALAATTVPFVILHFGKPMPELLGSIVAGLALGIVALRARSFIPAALLHFAVAATLDISAILL